jgi:outer membrane PBP1 activator LpoA protein
MPLPRALLNATLAVLLVLHSTGCQSTGAAPDSGARLDPAAMSDRVARADTLLANLPDSGAMREQRLLTAAALYLEAQAYAKADAALNRIDQRALARESRGSYVLASIDAAAGAGDLARAVELATPPPAGRLAWAGELAPADRARVAERRAALLERRGELAAAARDRGLANVQLQGDARLANERLLWDLLQRIDQQQLRELAGDPDAELRGWAELAAIYRGGLDDGALPPATRIAQWLQRNPAHGAARNLPADIARLQSTRMELPQRIAVLLPRQGKLAPVGLAIEHGLLAARHAAARDGLTAPELHFHDTSGADFMATWQRVAGSAPDIVIGPIDKEQIALLQALPSLPAPVIALNAPEVPGGPAGLFHFGLGIEDEADQVAARMLAAGQRRAGIILPDSDWGRRVANRFGASFTQGGGTVMDARTFQGNRDYGDTVRLLLDIGASEARHARVQKAIGATLAFEPVRRQDIDALLIVGNTLQATQLAPAVRYYYASDLPLYCTSNCNSQPTATAASDLSGLNMTEMPWIIDAQQPLRRDIAGAWPGADPRYERLEAMGVDAWRLALQWSLLQAMPGATLDGATGNLRLVDRDIRRELSWVRYRNGRLEPLQP